MNHPAEFEYWRSHQRNLLATAREFKRDPKTVRRWREREKWIVQANKLDVRAAQKLADAAAQHAREGEEALEHARTNHRAFQGIVAQMNIKLLSILRLPPDQQVSIDAFDVQQIVAANTADAKITVALYGVPQRIDVVKIPSPAESLQHEIADALAEIKRVDSGESIPAIAESS